MDTFDKIQNLMKTLEAGVAAAAPDKLVGGAALMSQDMSATMETVCYDDSHLKLQRMLKVESCKSTLAQFNRQLSYGIFGGSAQREGNVGQEQNSDFVRVVVPMCFYAHYRKTTDVANMVETIDGVKAEERQAKDAALLLAGDIEFESFRGMADFSNAGVFDGNPLATNQLLPNMHGIDLQIRQSDVMHTARDLMMAEYGSDETVVISGGGTLTQEMVEDASVRSAMNHGSADKLVVDPKVLSAYNKQAFGISRIVLGGSPQDATGADLRKQWVSGGTVSIEASRFLSGKTKPAPSRNDAPGAPSSISAITSATDANAVTAFKAAEVYYYSATGCNEIGESFKCAAVAGTVTSDGDKMPITINHGSGTTRYLNVYRTVAGGAPGTEKFIGRVLAASGSSTVFTDLGNKIPGFVTGFLLQFDTMGFKELAPFTRKKLAITELAAPEVFYRFITLCMYQPRKNVIVDNLR